MKNKIRSCVLLGLLLVLPSYAQKQANNWYFGSGAGLSWNTTRTVTATGMYGATGNTELHDLPVNAPGALINTIEGCFSLSDENGNLLFYSDGMTIWNRNHAIMENGRGLLGHNSSAQSGIIVNYPGSKTKFIAVSIGQFGQDSNLPTRNGQLTYSIIDMTLANGLGGVVATEKNIPLINFKGVVGESVTSIRHANGRDFWIVAPGRGFDSYLNAWLATPEGIVADTPVSTPFSPRIGSTNYQASGYIKFAPDGKSFAWTTNYSNQLHVGRFDAKTGKMSEPRTMSATSYGLEFSNSGKYLYTRGAEQSRVLTVYDFESLLVNGLTGSNTLVINNLTYGALQMGPDGRIYMGTPGTKQMFVIENPEEMDNLRIYKLDNFITGICQFGLPSFSASWFAIDKFKSTICLDEEAVYRISSSTGQVRIDFDEGEGKQIIDVPESGEIRHKFKKPGSYLVTVELYGGEAMEPQTAYTTVYSCFLPVNHTLSNSR